MYNIIWFAITSSLGRKVKWEIQYISKSLEVDFFQHLKRHESEKVQSNKPTVEAFCNKFEYGQPIRWY